MTVAAAMPGRDVGTGRFEEVAIPLRLLINLLGQGGLPMLEDEAPAFPGRGGVGEEQAGYGDGKEECPQAEAKMHGGIPDNGGGTIRRNDSGWH